MDFPRPVATFNSHIRIVASVEASISHQPCQETLHYTKLTVQWNRGHSSFDTLQSLPTEKWRAAGNLRGTLAVSAELPRHVIFVLKEQSGNKWPNVRVKAVLWRTCCMSRTNGIALYHTCFYHNQIFEFYSVQPII